MSLAGSFVQNGEAAMNLAQVSEDAVLRLRERVKIPDGLIALRSSTSCDSSVDGPYCSHIDLRPARATLDSSGNAFPPGRLTDGILPARLFGDTEEFLEATLLRTALPPGQARWLRSDVEKRYESAPSSNGEEPPSGARRGGVASLSKSALLSFRRLPPWQQGLPRFFAGAATNAFGSLPFKVEWEGPWALTGNPLPDGFVLKKHRFVAELQGPVGHIRFGRPVCVLQLEVSQPIERHCGVDGTTSATQSYRTLPTPLLVQGKLHGATVFSEAVAAWELGTFVNALAFTALTSAHLIDSLTFLGADCLLVAALQVSYGSEEALEKAEAHFVEDFASSKHQSQSQSGGGKDSTAKSAQQPTAKPKPKATSAKPVETSENMLLLSLKDGWRAYGWSEVQFGIVAGAASDAPLWSLNELLQHRGTFRTGVYDQAVRLPQDEVFEDPLPGNGPELLLQPRGLSEVLEGPIEAPLDVHRQFQELRNVSLFLNIIESLDILHPPVEGDTLSVAVPTTGLDLKQLGAELLRFAITLHVAANKKSRSLTNAISVFDAAWRQLGLDTLDSLLLRYNAIDVLYPLVEDQPKPRVEDQVQGFKIQAERLEILQQVSSSSQFHYADARLEGPDIVEEYLLRSVPEAPALLRLSAAIGLWGAEFEGQSSLADTLKDMLARAISSATAKAKSSTQASVVVDEVG